MIGRNKSPNLNASPIAPLPKFSKLELHVRYPGRPFRVSTHVSAQGALRVAEQLRDEEYLGRTVPVEAAGLKFAGRFVQESTVRGTFFNLKFLFDHPITRETLAAHIENNRVAAPVWERKYPRLGLRMIPDGSAPKPDHIILKQGPCVRFPRVINFTLAGILVEGTFEELGQLTAGQPMHFDLQINNGSVIRKLDAHIVRINDDLLPEEGRHFRQIALALAPASQAHKAYKTLLRDFLKAMPFSRSR